MGIKTGNPRGRPRGAKNRRTKELEAKMEEAARVMQEAMPGAFEGNAHDFLMFVYKNPMAAMKDRLAAATAAAPYEKPKLAAVELSGNDEKPLVHEHHHTDATAFAGRIAGLSSRESEGKGTGQSEHRN